METGTDRKPARVLVVDDEENITFLLESAMRHFGFRGARRPGERELGSGPRQPVRG